MTFRNEYLGDGAYADFDGYQVRLWTERETGIHEVYLDAQTMLWLLRLLQADSPDWLQTNDISK